LAWIRLEREGENGLRNARGAAIPAVDRGHANLDHARLHGNVEREGPAAQRFLRDDVLADANDYLPGSGRSNTGDVPERHLARRRRGDHWRGESRGVDHASIMAILAHLDLDAFYAAVEELEQPELRRKPLVVGGDPKGRGVVSTANYVARRFGIRSAMSCAEALRRCPEAVFVRPRHTLYREYSQAVWESVREVVPLVERTGLDEGYLDFAGLAADFSRARTVAEAVQTSVRAATSLSCSLGVAPTKVVAKVASDRRKPGGITVVRAGTEAAFLAPFAVRALPGIGPRAEERLAAAGVTTVGALAALSDLDLRALLPGQVGRMLRDRAQGLDPRRLETTSERISISVEETFERDLHDRGLLHAELRRMADDLGKHLRRNGQSARTVTAKLRYTDFSIRSRSTSLDVGIDDPERIGELACALLDRGLRDRPGALRLVGVGLSGLSDFRQLSLDERE
jgi:DNA polymerase-4